MRYLLISIIPLLFLAGCSGDGIRTSSLDAGPSGAPSGYRR